MNINPSLDQKIKRNVERIKNLKIILGEELTKSQRKSFQSELDRRTQELNTVKEAINEVIK